MKRSRNWNSRAVELATARGVEISYPEVRSRKKKKMSGEICEDEAIVNAKRNFKVNVYYRSLDVMAAKIKERFSDDTNTVHKFACLQPSHFESPMAISNMRDLASFCEADVSVDDVEDEYQYFTR